MTFATGTKLAIWVLGLLLSVMLFSMPVAKAQKAVGCTTSDDCNYQVLKAYCACTGTNCLFDGRQVDGSNYSKNDGPNKFCRRVNDLSCGCIPCIDAKNTCTAPPPPIAEFDHDLVPLAKIAKKLISTVPGGSDVLFYFDLVSPLLTKKEPDKSEWEKVKADVARFVDTKLADERRAYLLQELKGIGVARREYDGLAKDSPQAREKIISIQTIIETASCGFMVDSIVTKPEYLLLFPQLASIHLGVQLEVLRVHAPSENDAHNKQVLLTLMENYANIARAGTFGAINWRLGKVSNKLVNANDNPGGLGGGSTGGDYLGAADENNQEFGPRYYTCKQTLTEIPRNNATLNKYECWPVCRPDQAKADASSCLVNYRTAVEGNAARFWKSRLYDFAAEWEEIRPVANEIFPEPVDLLPWQNICDGDVLAGGATNAGEHEVYVTSEGANANAMTGESDKPYFGSDGLKTALDQANRRAPIPTNIQVQNGGTYTISGDGPMLLTGPIKITSPNGALTIQ